MNPRRKNDGLGNPGLMTVIFDWDLTLWNSWDIHLWLMHRTAEALNQPSPAKDEIARELSRPFRQHLNWFFTGDPEAVLDTYIGFYRDVVDVRAGLYPGVAEALQTLNSQGYKVAVFSDKREPFGVSELEQTGVAHLLNHVAFFDGDRPYKPDPRGLRNVMESLAASPSETIYVGDSPQDIECAHRAGTQSAAALWGTVTREAVLATGPHYRLEQVDQLLVCLGIAGYSAT